jgi:hypothetical protein
MILACRHVLGKNRWVFENLIYWRMFMRKFIVMLAAATLAVTPYAFAEDTTGGNPNDVLQTVPGQGTSTTEGMPTNGPTVADADNSGTPAAMDSKPSDAMSTTTTTTTKHHKKCKHHCKKHHHKHPKKTAESADAGTDTSAPASTTTTTTTAQ